MIVWSYVWITSGSNGELPFGWEAVAFLLHGMGSLVFGRGALEAVLAAWLVGRQGIWGNWWGRLRAGSYLAAFTAGCVMEEMAASWMQESNADPYQRLVHGLVSVLIFAWLFLPAFTLLRGQLCGDGPCVYRDSSFSVRLLFGWTALAALVLAAVRLLAKDWEIHQSLDGEAQAVALAQFVAYDLRESITHAAAVMLIIVAWSGMRAMPVAAFAGAVVFEATADQLLHVMYVHLSGGLVDQALFLNEIEAWWVVIGGLASAWLAFGGAAMTGDHFRRVRHLK